MQGSGLRQVCWAAAAMLALSACEGLTRIVEPLIEGDAGAPAAAAADGGSTSPVAHVGNVGNVGNAGNVGNVGNAGNAAPAADGGGRRPPPSTMIPGRPPAADGGKPAPDCRFDPLQPDAASQNAATDAIALPSSLFAFGSDEHGGFWVLAGRDSAQLIHVDATGAPPRGDELGALPDYVRFAPGDQPVIAASFERQAIALTGLSVGDPMKRGVFVVRRGPDAFTLLAQLEWMGQAPTPMPVQVVSAADGGAYVLVQLYGQGTIATSTGDAQYAAPDDSYSKIVIGIDASGHANFIKPVPDIATSNAIALGANANVLVAGEAKLQLWSRAGDMLLQLAFPSLGYGEPPRMKTDAAGNVYVGLTFGQPLRLAAQTFTPRGGAIDILLLKYAPDGTLAWSKQLGDNASEYLRALELDGQGNVLLTGGFVGRTDLGNGAIDSQPPRDPNAGYEATDAFVAKFAPDGSVLASTRYGSDLGDDSLAVIPIDDSQAWLCALLTGSDGSTSAQAVRVRFDGGALMPPPVDLHEPFARISGPAAFGTWLAASDDQVVVGPTLNLLQFDGSKLVVHETLERPSDAPPTFGAALAITSDLVVVGGAPAPDSSLSYALPPGAVHVYERDGDHFVRRAQLQPAGGAPQGFGHAVAIAMGSVFVAALDGSVYGFDRDASGWHAGQQLTAAAGPGVRENFGWALAAQGDDLVVAHPGHQTPDNHAGVVYVYRRSAGSWQVHEQLTDPLAPLAHVDCHEVGCTATTHFGFGTQVAADANSLVASLGAIPLVGVFDRSGDMNTPVQLLGDPSVADVDRQLRFGSSCDIGCFTRTLSVRQLFLAIGEPATTLGTVSAAGVATVYQRVSDHWFERGQLHSGAPRQMGYVGMSVALHANGLAIGAPGEGDNGGGAVFDMPLSPAACK